MINRWDYKVLSKFNDIFYKDLLQKKHVLDGEKFIKTVNTPESTESDEQNLNNFFFVLQKGHNKYLLQSEYINELPIFVKDFDRVGYKGEGYNLIKSYETARFKPERQHSFRELIDNLATISHDTTKHFTLWKIICMTSYIDRINIRVSSQPSFGKDSVMDLLNDLVSSVAVVQKPTIAKLEYLSMNKILMVNELMNLSKQEYRDIEQYLLSVGAFKNNYTKRSRAQSEGREEYDISKLSLVLAYNNVEDYPDGSTEYFDRVQTNQVKERFLPLKFGGVITERFLDIPDAEKIAMENKGFFISMARSIRYYEENWRKELKAYPEINFGLLGRWKRNFETISHFINLYSESEEEYKDLMMELYKCHTDYLGMVRNGSRFEVKTETPYADGKLIVEELYIEDIDEGKRKE
jgi:hypothetical protein